MQNKNGGLIMNTKMNERMESFNAESVIRYVGESQTRVIDSKDVAKMINKTHKNLNA